MDLKEIENASGNRHPWELSRAKSILKVLKDLDCSVIADIGSGDLYFAQEAHKLTQQKIYACDINYSDTEIVDNGQVEMCKDINDIPRNSIDLVFLLDVLEHVENENLFLQEVKHVLKDGGRMVITVPAHQFLFSEHDIFLQHFRRYSKKRLTQVLKENNMEVEGVFYFYSSLFCVRLVTKALSLIGLSRKYRPEVNSWGYSRDHLLTRLLISILNLDFTLNKNLHSISKHSLPGLSLCATVRKPA